MKLNDDSEDLRLHQVCVELRGRELALIRVDKRTYDKSGHLMSQ